MLLSELKRTAMRAGEDRRLVVGAINPLQRYYSTLRRHIEANERGETRYSSYAEHSKGVTSKGSPTVEWYIDNIMDEDPYYFRYAINGFGPKRKEYMDYLVSTYYEGGPAVDIYEMPPGQDY